MVRKADLPEILRLYNAGFSDGQIADTTGYMSAEIKYWRKKSSLQSNTQRGKRGPDKGPRYTSRRHEPRYKY